MGHPNLPPSWPGFVPAIHAFMARVIQDVDTRDKRGHDEKQRHCRASEIWSFYPSRNDAAKYQYL